MTWRDDIEEALESLEGMGTLKEIYAVIPEIRRRRGKPLRDNWRSIVRRELQENSEESRAC
jgi:hypothetical protein